MREFIDKSTVNISKTIGGQNDFADCIRDSVKAVIDNAETVTEQEIVRPYLDKLKAIIRQWYWNSDVQKIATDPCVVDAMIDMYIRTIDRILTDLKEKDV